MDPIQVRPIAAPTLRGPSDTLAHAAPARPRTFLLAVPGATARGVETRGLDAVERGGRLLLAGLSVAGARCGNVLLAPGHARRELLGPFGGAMEVLLLTPDGLVAQWTGDAELQVDALLPGSRWRTEAGRLTVEEGDGVRVLEVDPQPAWSVGEERGRIVVRARLAPGIARLAATVGADAAEAEGAFARLARAREAHAEADAHALRTRRLWSRTGVPELDDGLAWATARLDAALGAGAEHVHELAAGEAFPFDPASRRAWTALGAVASGASPDLGGLGTSELELFARARAALWRGTRIGVPGTLPQLDADPARSAGRRGALLALADAVEPWEGKERARTLREAAAARGGPVKLPTLGAARSLDPLASALDLPSRAGYAPPSDDPASGVQRALAAWACLNDGALERGFALFRQHLADGFAQGVGLWRDAARIHDPAAAALVPLVVLEGLLGARGDAHYGRLRLSPRLPPHWTKLTVGGIALGASSMRLEYEWAASAHVFRIAQESGAVPVMLVFEPIVPVAPSAPVRIDGAAAQVDVTPAAGRAQLRVQLPLDRERVISIG